MAKIANTREGLAKKAVMLGRLVPDMAEGAIESVFHLIKDSETLSYSLKGVIKKESDVAPKMLLEYILIYLHLIDRIAVECLPAEQRYEFQGGLVRWVIKESQKVYKEKFKNAEAYHGLLSSNFEDAFGDLYNERQREYSEYVKLIAGPGEAAGGTLFWDFGKRIGSILGHTDVITVMGAQGAAVQGVTFLNTKDLLQ